MTDIDRSALDRELMAMKRPPIPELRPFVAIVWSAGDPLCNAYDQPIREHRQRAPVSQGR
jgi:hypothetical protein